MKAVFRPRRLEIENKVKKLAADKKMPLDITTAQRTVGPQLNVSPPPQGTEVFVTKLPREIFEDKLYPLFETAGNIYKFRMMMSPSGISTRGQAFITYTTSEMALGAIEMFDDMEIAPGHRIVVKKSVDNRRLFIGGIPEGKSKDQVWQELLKIGVKGIMEVIMYRSYIDRNLNRGFVFVEFNTHEEAARVRVTYKNAFLFGNRVQIDWSAPQHEVDDSVMKQVTKLFVRNLNVLQEPAELMTLITDVLGDKDILEKVYKYRDYAFIHFVSRRDAQRGLTVLREYYKNTCVEVTWAKPAPSERQKREDPSAIAYPTYTHKADGNNNVSGNLRTDNAQAREMQTKKFVKCPNCLTAFVIDDVVESVWRIFESLNL